MFKAKIKREIVKNRRRIKKLGPGIITGGAGDDPAGIVTYTIVGATTGFSQLWLLLLSTPMMVALQNAVSQIAIVTGKSLPEITTAFYSKKMTIFIVLFLAIANILTIGADLNGVAAVLHILTGYDTIYFLFPITAFIVGLILFGAYRVIKRFFITLSIVLIIYIIAAFLAKPDISQLFVNTFIPHIQWQSAWILAALGLLGTTISPYILFWQAAEEREEKKSVVQADEVTFDTVIGMVYSNLLAYSMIVTGALMLYGKGNIESVEQLALALKPVAGSYSFVIFTLGIIVSGFLAIPVLAGSTAYAVADTFGWREGMDNKVSNAKGFYFVFVGALIFGNIIDMIPEISVVDALYYSQIFDGFLIPVLIVITLLIANNREIMGNYTASKFTNIFSLFTFIVTLFLAFYTIYSLLKDL